MSAVAVENWTDRGESSLTEILEAKLTRVRKREASVDFGLATVGDVLFVDFLLRERLGRSPMGVAERRALLRTAIDQAMRARCRIHEPGLAHGARPPRAVPPAAQLVPGEWMSSVRGSRPSGHATSCCCGRCHDSELD